MSELTPSYKLEDDLAILKSFHQEADFQANSTLSSLLSLLLAIGLGFAAAFTTLVLPSPSIAAICTVTSITSFVYFCVLQIKSSKKLLPPMEILMRVASSRNSQSAEVIFPLYERYQYQNSEKYDAMLLQYLPAFDTLDIKIDNKPLVEILTAILYRVQFSSPELALTIIETFVRCNATEVFTKLLMLGEGFSSTSPHQRVKSAAREASLLLSAKTNFGAKEDIPAKVKELYRLHFFDNGSSISNERHIWLAHALTQLLPQLTKADANLFDKKHRNQLYTLAGKGYTNISTGRSESELRQAIVLMLGNIEDTDALPVLSELARMDAPTDHERDTRTLARKHLAILTQIKEKQKVGSMLLRASDAPAIAQDQLLRPAHATEEAQPETLLRPHLGE